ncbi:MAG: sugar phosphate isomerase/epimerase [Acidobacteriota bacterium]|nr:MAG: sugar phosphate isomerase/epimerase [Acidobacteriota bacterium]
MKSSRIVLLLLVAVLFISSLWLGTFPAAAQEGLGRLDVLLCNPLIASLEMGSTWEAAKAVGVSGIEVHVEPDLSCSRLYVGDQTPYRIDNAQNAFKIARDAAEHGLVVPVLVAPLKLDPQEALNTGAPAWALQLIEFAPAAGASLVYFPIVTDNFTKPTYSDEEFIEAAVFVLNDLVEHARKFPVQVGFENLSVYWNRPEVLRGVLSQFEADELGFCLDPINFYWFGHPRSEVYSIVQEFIPRAYHFHVKNVAHPVDKREVRREPGWQYSQNSVAADQGDLDFEKLIGLLLDANYNGLISIEDDSLGKVEAPQRLEILRSDVEYVRRIVRGYLGGSE